MAESWIDLAKMLWNEMNPVEGYTYDSVNDAYKRNAYKQPVVQLNEAKNKVVYKNNVNDIIDAESMLKDKYNGYKLKFKYTNPQKVYLPNEYKGSFLRYPNIKSDLNKEYYRLTIVPEEDIKYVNNNFDKIKNRIPTQTLGKMATKILQSPVVQVGGKILDSSVIPLTVFDMLKLQGVYPYKRQDYEQILNDMGIRHSNGQIQL